ncbi:MAG TPA: hypothetical protein VG935_00905 [Patescibacteria group bacterium]|nr:hypothetical protein [Patescibacteria group bacterium]
MMRTEEISPKVVVAVLAVILLFVAYYLGLKRVDTYLHNGAIDACAAASSYQKNDKAQNAVITYPIQDVYQNCLKQKGIN